jgi:hypothetical protein
MMHPQTRPIAVLTDDRRKAMNDLVVRHGKDVTLFCTNRWEVKCQGDIWYKIFTDERALGGYQLKSWEELIYHSNNKESRRNMAAMRAVVPYRVRN